MSRPETSLWEYLRQRMPHGGHYSRIETDTAPGFPDVHYTLDSHTGGIELKAQPFPTGEFPFEGERKGLRKSQKHWIRDEIYAGGRVLICVQCRETIFWLDGRFWNLLDKMTVKDLMHNADLVWERGGDCDPNKLAELMKARQG